MLRRVCATIGILLLVVLVIPLARTQEEETFSLTIMHTNDEHAAHEPDANGDGGTAQQATVGVQLNALICCFPGVGK